MYVRYYYVRGCFFEYKQYSCLLYTSCFPTAEELEEHLKLLEEAKERDHRKIGKEMELFMSDDLIGRGLPMFLPKGYTVWQELENYICLLYTSAMIRMVVENAHAEGIWAGICGELGADTTLTEEFLKMGVDELSVSAGKVLAVRKVIRETRIS